MVNFGSRTHLAIMSDWGSSHATSRIGRFRHLSRSERGPLAIGCLLIDETVVWRPSLSRTPKVESLASRNSLGFSSHERLRYNGMYNGCNARRNACTFLNRDLQCRPRATGRLRPTGGVGRLDVLWQALRRSQATQASP